MKNLIMTGLLCGVLLGATSALAWDSGTMHQTLPGTSIPDYSEPGLRIESGFGGETIMHQTYPGTSVPDYSKPGLRIETDSFGRTNMYQTFPGTSVRDYSKPGFIMD